jgi:UDP-glucose 4-epimerase
MRVLVTGGAGYIGSHAVRALHRAGHQPVVLDNLVYGHEDIVTKVLKVPLVLGQVGDRDVLESLLRGRHPNLVGTALEGRPIEAVLHFAAYAYVGESVQDPAKYYRNNLGDTLTLLEALVATEKPLPIVFSSTCATYGLPQQIPMAEDHPQAPINPYGRGKWMAEQLLNDFGHAYGLPSVIFRYFNAAGADPDGDLGEDHDPETHLIPRVLDVMSSREPYLQIFGDDYPTADGTCIRDYIHVADLANAHVLGLQRIVQMRDSGEPTDTPLIIILDLELVILFRKSLKRRKPLRVADYWRMWRKGVRVTHPSWWPALRRPNLNWVGNRSILICIRSSNMRGVGISIVIHAEQAFSLFCSMVWLTALR